MARRKTPRTQYPRIENVQLISPEDFSYKSYCKKFKTVNSPQVIQTAIATNNTAYHISHALEETVIEWIKKSGLSLETRIISFEKRYSPYKSTRLFKELDYVLIKDRTLIIGELKVSNSNPTSKALEQTYESRELLKSIYPSIEVEIIWIDLNSKYSKKTINQFNVQFLDSQFADLDCTGEIYKFKQKIKFLHLDVQNIFNWGVENKIIRTPQLVLAALEEAEYVSRIKSIKKKIKLLEKETVDNIDETINLQIVDYENDILSCKARLELYQKGWTIINFSIKSQVFKLLDNETISIVQTNHYPEFKTENQKIKFLVFQKPFHSEIQIVHAGNIYSRYRNVLQNKIEDIENVFVHFDTDKYPLVTNQGRRKFCYDYDRIDISQRSNPHLEDFKKIIDDSVPLGILLNDNEILIIDNHLILHKL